MLTPNPHTRVLPVVAGIIVADRQVLCARKASGKPMAGYWEFPGGKIDSEETPKQALKRELSEELGIIAQVGDFFSENYHQQGDIVIRLQAYWVMSFRGDIRLTDHDAIRWLVRDCLDDLKWAPADQPFVDKLLAARWP